MKRDLYRLILLPGYRWTGSSDKWALVRAKWGWDAAQTTGSLEHADPVGLRPEAVVALGPDEEARGK